MLWLHGFVNKIVYKVSFFNFIIIFFYKMYLCSASDIMSVHTMTILHLNKSCYTHGMLVLLSLALQSIVLSCILGKPP